MADEELVIRIPEGLRKDFEQEQWTALTCMEMKDALLNGTPIPDNATNGDVIKAMFSDDKVSEFMGYVRILARAGNWFNEGVVAEIDKDWWNSPYQKGGKE